MKSTRAHEKPLNVSTVRLTLLVILGLSAIQTLAKQSQNPPPSQTSHPSSVDGYDRNAELWNRQRVGTSSLERGQEIYYMRCWMCHNEYTIAADQSPDYAAPTLRDLFKRAQLRNGKPVNDDTVTAEIRNGNIRMPAFTPATMTDKDLSDLLLYLKQKCGTYKTGGGCWDEHNPPRNPRYRY